MTGLCKKNSKVDKVNVIAENLKEDNQSSSSSSEDSDSDSSSNEGGKGEEHKDEEGKKEIKEGGKQKYEGLTKQERKHKVKE